MIYLINIQTAVRILLILAILFIVNCHQFTIRKTRTEQSKNINQETADTISDGIDSAAEELNPEQAASDIPLLNGKNLLEQKSKNKKGKIVTTRIYGAELVREKITEKGISFTRISIRGNATIDHEGVLIIAPQIILDNGEIGITVGGVQIIDRKQGLNIRAGSAIYTKSEENVVLSNNPYMTIKKNKNESQTLITTNSMIRDLSESKTLLEGDVRIYRDGWTVLGDRGNQSDQMDEIILEKNPVILDRDRFLTGNNLHYKLKDKKIVLDGRVFSILRAGRITAPDAEKNEIIPLEEFARKGGELPSKKTAGINDTSEIDKELSVLSSDSIVYNYTGSEYPVAEIHGNVLLTQEDFYLKSPLIKTMGKSFETIYTKNGVEMLDRKENIHVTAGEMFYERSKRFMRLDLYPKMEFLKKDSEEIEGTLEASVIETNFNTKETLARGNVLLSQKQFTATGEIATYKSEEDLIIMEGSPSITQGGGTVSSEKIYIYPRTNRVLLKNRIRGSMSEG